MLDVRKYLFHLHTDFTDGKLSVRDYFEFAHKRGIERLIFLEHIRRALSYNIRKFIAEIGRCSDTYEIVGVVGFEAKILPSGKLDIDPEHLELAQFIGVAEHGFPDDVKMLVEAFEAVLDFYPGQYTDKQFVWVHPGLWFRQRNLLLHPVYWEMLAKAGRYPIWIEHNLRYELPCKGVPIPQSARAIVGLDAHTLGDLMRFLP